MLNKNTSKVSYNGIEFHLSPLTLWSLEQSLQQTLAAKNKNKIVLKFEQILNGDKFYQSLIEALHINSSIDLIEQSVGALN